MAQRLPHGDVLPDTDIELVHRHDLFSPLGSVPLMRNLGNQDRYRLNDLPPLLQVAVDLRRGEPHQLQGSPQVDNLYAETLILIRQLPLLLRNDPRVQSAEPLDFGVIDLVGLQRGEVLPLGLDHLLAVEQNLKERLAGTDDFSLLMADARHHPRDRRGYVDERVPRTFAQNPREGKCPVVIAQLDGRDRGIVDLEIPLRRLRKRDFFSETGRRGRLLVVMLLIFLMVVPLPAVMILLQGEKTLGDGPQTQITGDAVNRRSGTGDGFAEKADRPREKDNPKQYHKRFNENSFFPRSRHRYTRSLQRDHPQDIPSRA